MRVYRYLVFLSICLLALEAGAQSSNIALTTEYPKEKTFVHTDRDYYTAGGEIFYKIYIAGNNGKIINQKTDNVYLDIINEKGEIVQSQLILLQKGTAAAQLTIDQGLTRGKYVLRAYSEAISKDEAQFFRKTLFINGRQANGSTSVQVNDTIYVDFFAEGGNLMANDSCRISYLATNNKGVPTKINGTLHIGEQIKSIQSNINGMGSFEYFSKNGDKWDFETNKLIKYRIPEIIDKGISLRCDINEEVLKIKIDQINPSEEIQVIVHQDKIVYLNNKINSDQFEESLLLENLPAGILHVTVIDQDNRPKAERLVFNVIGTDNYNIDINTNKEEFAQRDKVVIQLDVYDDDGNSLSSDLSVSVTDSYISKPININANIQASNYLNAYLNNLIINPNIYFSYDNDNAITDLDLLMRTYGWRNFKKINNYKLNNPGISINGKITKLDNQNKGIKASGFISILGANISTLPFVTDGDGNLFINQLEFYGNRDIVVQGEVFKEKSKSNNGDELKLKGNRNVDITLEGAEKQLWSDFDEQLFFYEEEIIAQANIVSETEDIKVNPGNFDEVEMSIDLDEVEISETKINEVIASYKPGMTYSNPNDRIMTAKIQNIGQYRDIYDILKGRVTGLQLEGPDAGMMAKHKVILRGYTSGGVLTSDGASFFLNGNYVPQIQVESINPQDIAFVDVVKSLYQLAAYGEAGANGIVFIYLKPPGLRIKRKANTYNGIMSTVLEGYAESREFFSPRYDGTGADSFDNRITIHWEPNLTIDDNGTAYIEFYTADKSTIYNVDVQGISNTGLPMAVQSSIIIRE